MSGERIVQQAGIFLYTKLVLLYGTVAYAAHQVGLSIESFLFSRLWTCYCCRHHGGPKHWNPSILEETRKLGSQSAGHCDAEWVSFFFFPYVASYIYNR